jgi:hypothetical protein
MQLSRRVVLQKDLTVGVKSKDIFQLSQAFPFHKDNDVGINCLQIADKNFLSGISNLGDI